MKGERLAWSDAFLADRRVIIIFLEFILRNECRDAGNFSPPMSDAKLLGNAMCLAHVVTFTLVRSKSGTSVSKSHLCLMIWPPWSILIARYES